MDLRPHSFIIIIISSRRRRHYCICRYFCCCVIRNNVPLISHFLSVVYNSCTGTQGVTAVHLAAQNGHTDVVSLLLSRSSGLIRIADKHGRTPLHLSAAHGHYDMTQLLIGQGADIDAYDKVT